MIAILQPYVQLESHHISALAKNGSYYLVSQSYDRANGDMEDHTKKPILFTAYKELKEASVHYTKIKSDKLAAIMDIRKTNTTARLVNLCNGKAGKVPYLTHVANVQLTNNFLRKHYYGKYRTWVRKNRPAWMIREHNAIEPNFETIMGEPWVKITWGSHFAMVSLAELETI